MQALCKLENLELSCNGCEIGCVKQSWYTNYVPVLNAITMALLLPLLKTVNQLYVFHCVTRQCGPGVYKVSVITF